MASPKLIDTDGLTVFKDECDKAYLPKVTLSAVATSGSYTDLSNKPTIPTVPTALKNPNALTFTGAVTGSYDGSAAKSVNIPAAQDLTPYMKKIADSDLDMRGYKLKFITGTISYGLVGNQRPGFIIDASNSEGVNIKAPSVLVNESPIATKTDLSKCVKSINNLTPDSSGNVNISTSGGGGSGDYLPLTGGTVNGGITATNFQTGTGAANYFQCCKFRGEGNANSYYHAIDFGYSGHDSVDFYEYDPNWNFYKCTTGTKSGAVLVGNINGNGWNGGARLTGAPTAPTATVGTNTTQIATTAFVQAAIPTNISSFSNDAGYIKSVNNTKPDASGNVNISVSGGGGGSNVTVDTTLSATSTNAIANKAVYAALSDKLGKSDIAIGAQRAFQDGDGNIISLTYVKSVNGAKPDSKGNVSISASGGGASTSTQNTWTAQQSFDLVLLDVEKYKTSYDNGNSVKPSKVTAVYNATGSFTLDLTNFSYLLSIGQSLVFTAYIKANADYPLTITNGGTLKYTGNPSDLAITSAGLLLNIFITLDNSGNKTSIVQASKLS